MPIRQAALIVAIAVLAVVAPTATPRPAAAMPNGQYVVSLAADAAPTLPGMHLPGNATLGRNLLDGLDVGKLARESRGAPAAPLAPHEFDPARVWLIEAADSSAAAASAAELVRAGIAEWAEPVLTRESCELPPGFPNDPLYRDGRQWGLFNDGSRGGLPGADIHALAAWQLSCGAAWLRLAVLDTGIDPAHPDLQLMLPEGPRIEQGINITGEPSQSWADSAAHGTAVAGVMAALTHDGPHFDSLGVSGACGGDGSLNPGCHIVPVKITAGRATSASTFDLARGIVAAVAAGARVANLSFGGAGPSRVEREAMRYAIERNCLVVAASGNRGAVAPREAVYPAAYSADGLCMQVGAADAWDHRAGFSSYGPGLDVVAPGADIWTTFLTYPSAAGATYPGYVAVSGTSFAAPFVTGAAGLLAAARPELFADDLRELIWRHARDIGAPGVDEETGAGMLDAAASLRAVEHGLGIWHDEVAATAWQETGVDSLVVGETGIGNMLGPRTWSVARRIEARATIVLPDSFSGEVFAWPRIAGTSTVRGDFRLPYFAPLAQVEWLDARSFALKGWLYRVASGDDSLDIPLPFDQARFSFTVLGPVHRPWLAREGTLRAAGLHVGPNPFCGALRIEAPAGACVDVLDIGGRRVRRWRPDGSVTAIVWDGRNAAGSHSPPGLYWVRALTPRGVSQLRVIKLE